MSDEPTRYEPGVRVNEYWYNVPISATAVMVQDTHGLFVQYVDYLSVYREKEEWKEYAQQTELKLKRIENEAKERSSEVQELKDELRKARQKCEDLKQDADWNERRAKEVEFGEDEKKERYWKISNYEVCWTPDGDTVYRVYPADASWTPRKCPFSVDCHLAASELSGPDEAREVLGWLERPRYFASTVPDVVRWIDGKGRRFRACDGEWNLLGSPYGEGYEDFTKFGEISEEEARRRVEGSKTRGGDRPIPPKGWRLKYNEPRVPELNETFLPIINGRVDTSCVLGPERRWWGTILVDVDRILEGLRERGLRRWIVEPDHDENRPQAMADFDDKGGPVPF